MAIIKLSDKAMVDQQLGRKPEEDQAIRLEQLEKDKAIAAAAKAKAEKSKSK